jgi:hypothetical protein
VAPPSLFRRTAKAAEQHRQVSSETIVDARPSDHPGPVGAGRQIVKRAGRSAWMKLCHAISYLEQIPMDPAMNRIRRNLSSNSQWV